MSTECKERPRAIDQGVQRYVYLTSCLAILEVDVIPTTVFGDDDIRGYMPYRSCERRHLDASNICTLAHNTSFDAHGDVSIIG